MPGLLLVSSQASLETSKKSISHHELPVPPQEPVGRASLPLHNASNGVAIQVK